MTLLKRVDGFIRSHPVVISAVLALLAYWHGYQSPGLLLLGPILLDDVNTVTTKTIMPGVVDSEVLCYQ